VALVSSLLLAACGPAPWNDPYPRGMLGEDVLLGAFTEEPKHLDPARSYSANEYRFLAQIVEPPLQYHYLRRPYTLVPLTVEAVPEAAALDARGRPAPEGAQPAYTEYVLRLRPGIRYQPHPAFARDEAGRFRYHGLEALDAGIRSPADFPHQDTRELTAADYVYQIKRLADPRNHCPIAGLLAEHIVGFRALNAELAERDRRGLDPGWRDLRAFELAGVEALDRHRLRIRIQGRYPQFVYWLAMPFFAPMPWEADRFYAQSLLAERNLTLDRFPVGTGPYMLVENDPNRRIVLARNPHFHGETYPAEGAPGDREAGLLADAGRPLPLVKRAVYSLEKETIPYWTKFLQGYYDTSGVTSDSFDQAIRVAGGERLELTEAMRARGIGLVSAVNTSIFYMGFNMLDPVVGGYSAERRALRQAIAIAVDYDEFIAIFLNGRGVEAHGPIPPGIFGHLEGREGINPYVFDWVDGRPRRKPLSEARRLLAEAGYPDGIDPATGRPLILYFDTLGTGPEDRARLNWFRKQFAKLGIQLVIRNTDYNRFQDKMRNGTAQIFQWGWNADYPDPENFLFLLYGPNGKVAHGGENAANYANADFDRQFERVRAMPDGPERLALIRKMVRMVQRDAPWLFGFYPKTLSLHHAWVGNLKPNLMANNTLKYLRVDGAERAARAAAWNEPVLWPLGLLAAGLVLLVVPVWRVHRRRERETAL
jgi:ABC-type transport system substrate-binding protein